LIERIKKVLQRYQEGSVEPQPVPVNTDVPVETLKWLFGRVRFNGRTYTYSENGPVSKLWKETCKKRGRWLRLREVHETSINKKLYRVFLFEDGLAIAHREGEQPEVL
jgi:hypothetical protein